MPSTRNDRIDEGLSKLIEYILPELEDEDEDEDLKANALELAQGMIDRYILHRITKYTLSYTNLQPSKPCSSSLRRRPSSHRQHHKEQMYFHPKPPLDQNKALAKKASFLLAGS